MQHPPDAALFYDEQKAHQLFYVKIYNYFFGTGM